MADDLLQNGDNTALAQPKKTRAPRTHIQMKRDAEVHPAPHTANVHVDEIDNWAKHGWERAD